jgi:hypothetical protein
LVLDYAFPFSIIIIMCPQIDIQLVYRPTAPGAMLTSYNLTRLTLNAVE